MTSTHPLQILRLCLILSIEFLPPSLAFFLGTSQQATADRPATHNYPTNGRRPHSYTVLSHTHGQASSEVFTRNTRHLQTPRESATSHSLLPPGYSAADGEEDPFKGLLRSLVAAGSDQSPFRLSFHSAFPSAFPLCCFSHYLLGVDSGGRSEYRHLAWRRQEDWRRRREPSWEGERREKTVRLHSGRYSTARELSVEPRLHWVLLFVPVIKINHTPLHISISGHNRIAHVKKKPVPTSTHHHIEPSSHRSEGR